MIPTPRIMKLKGKICVLCKKKPGGVMLPVEDSACKNKDGIRQASATKSLVTESDSWSREVCQCRKIQRSNTKSQIHIGLTAMYTRSGKGAQPKFFLFIIVTIGFLALEVALGHFKAKRKVSWVRSWRMGRLQSRV